MAERNTMQKTIVLNALRSLGNHPTADNVYEYIQKDYPSISRATVYRVLNRSAESGMIQKVNVNNGADHFDHTLSPHYHICCKVCGRVCDAELPYMEGLERKAGEHTGYIITGYSIQFDGYCPDCADKEDAYGQ